MNFSDAENPIWSASNYKCGEQGHIAQYQNQENGQQGDTALVAAPVTQQWHSNIIEVLVRDRDENSCRHWMYNYVNNTKTCGDLEWKEQHGGIGQTDVEHAGK